MANIITEKTMKNLTPQIHRNSNGGTRGGIIYVDISFSFSGNSPIVTLTISIMVLCRIHKTASFKKI